MSFFSGLEKFADALLSHPDTSAAEQVRATRIKSEKLNELLVSDEIQAIVQMSHVAGDKK